MQKFNIGDTVEFISKSNIWNKGEQHLITGVIYNQGIFKYETDQGAWFTNKDFKLISKVTKESLKKLDKLLEEVEFGEEL